MEFKNQQSEAIDNLLATQDLLGGLGFTLTADGGYYKDYALLDGAVARLTPVFDRGMSLDVAHRLTGFNITSTRFVPLIGETSLSSESIPAECKADMSVVINGLGYPTHRPMVENYMINAQCSTCGKDVASFFRIGGEDTCMRCMGFDND